MFDALLEAEPQRLAVAIRAGADVRATRAASLMNPLHFAGGEGQLRWRFGVWAPGTQVQDTRVAIRPRRSDAVDAIRAAQESQPWRMGTR